jgi:ubiquinone/menaquinone biosynthesis C-methylase UbiE
MKADFVMSRIDELQNHQTVRDAVRQGYASVALAEGPAKPQTADQEGCCSPTCCGGQVDSSLQLAQAVGYSPEELAHVPQGANMGLSCGNPTALAALCPGEKVLDLGAGGGFDVFIAGRKVGVGGRVIGVDMTPEMVGKARRNQRVYTETTGLDNVEFRLGEIEHLPLADGSVDVVISNCVINLSPDKLQVYREIARVLKPGGRVAVSDIVLKKRLPSAIREDVQALVGCVAGALLLSDLRSILEQVGLVEAEFEEKPAYVEVMETSKDHIAQRVLELLEPGESLADYIASMNISARKPE